MQAIKNALVILVLIGVAYGAYVVLYRTYGSPPPGVDTDVSELNLSRGVETSLGASAVGDPMPGLPSGQLSPPPSLMGNATPNVQPPSSSATPNAPSAAPAIPPLTVQPPTPNPSTTPSATPGPSAQSSQPPGTAAPASQYPVTSANPFAAGSTQPPTTVQPSAPAAQPATPAADPADAAEIALKWETAQQHLHAKKLLEAHELLSDLYGHPGLTPEQDAKVTELLGQLAGTIIYDSSPRFGLVPPYVVQAGDTLEKIAAEHKVSPVFLAKVNGLTSPSDVRPGDTLKVVRGPFLAIVDLRPRREEVTLVLDGRYYAGRFPIVRPVGNDFVLPQKDDQVFSVVEKHADDLWIGLGGKLGLHKASDDGRPGTRDSIRLAARDAQDLYDLLTLESRVAIRR
jgi:hypothetical protein